MTSHPALPCLFLPAWCPAQLEGELQVVCSGGRQAATRPLAEALARFGGDSIALVVPVEHVSSCAVALPAGSVHWQRQALPYAMEPLLAEAVEDLHLTLGARLADGRHRAVAIRRALLEGWLAYLRAAGARVTAIHVDADLLPNQLPSLCWQADRCLLAGTGELRLALPPSQLPPVLEQLGDNCRVFLEAGAAPVLPADTQISLEVLDLPVHAWLVRQRAQALDLAPGTSLVTSRGGLRRWRPLAAALAMLVLAQLAFDGVQLWVLNRQAAAYRQVNEAIYRGLFPEERRIVDLKAQFDQHLRQDSSAAHFSRLLEAVAGALPADTAMQLEQLRFDPARAQMTLQLHGGDSAGYQALQQQLQAARLQVSATPLEAGAWQLTVGGGQ